MKKIVAPLFAVCLLASCDQNKNNNSGLSPDQKSRFVSTLDSVGRAQDAIRLAGAMTLVSDDDRARMSSSLSRRHCQTSASGFGGVPGVSNSSSNVTLTAAGEGCPVSMNMSVAISHSQTPTGNETSGLISCDYSVKDPDYSSFNDIDAISERGTVHQSITFGSGMFTAEGAVNVTGTLHSQKYGAVAMQIIGKTSGSSTNLVSEIDYSFQYSDMNVVLKQVSTANQNARKENYYLNDVEITKDEFTDLLSRGGPVVGAGLGN